MSILEKLGIPEVFGATLLLFSLILTLAPYFTGNDFGIFKIPRFSRVVRRRLYVVGPLMLLLAASLHIPLLSTEEPQALANFTVKVIRGNRTIGHGLVTPKGFIIVPSELVSKVPLTDLFVSWAANDQDRPIPVKIAGNAQMALAPITLLKPNTAIQPTPQVSIRRAGSLKIGEEIELYISPTDRTPGLVKDVYASKEIHTTRGPVTARRLLITTAISAAGDSGGAVIDKEGKVVGMLFGGSQRESVVIPIEDIRARFLEAF
jgi:hypothetical protein